jgi:hypothetical protein
MHIKEYWFYFTVANVWDAKKCVDIIESKGYQAYRQALRVYHYGPLPESLWSILREVNTL